MPAYTRGSFSFPGQDVWYYPECGANRRPACVRRVLDKGSGLAELTVYRVVRIEAPYGIWRWPAGHTGGPIRERPRHPVPGMGCIYVDPARIARHAWIVGRVGDDTAILDVPRIDEVQAEPGPNPGQFQPREYHANRRRLPETCFDAA